MALALYTQDRTESRGIDHLKESVRTMDAIKLNSGQLI